MHIKILLCRWIANHIETRARAERRALRDYQRHEGLRINALEKRSRGLRLYAAWVRRPGRNNIRETSENWPLPQAASGILATR
jgi:hypothetical protein